MRYLDEHPFTVEELNTYTDKFEIVSQHATDGGEYSWAVDASYRVTLYEGIKGIETYDEGLKAWNMFAVDCDPNLDISFLSAKDWEDIPF